MAASRARTMREPITMMAMMPPRLMCLPSRHQWPKFLLQDGAASDWDTDSSVGLKLPPLAAMAACRRHAHGERKGTSMHASMMTWLCSGACRIRVGCA